MALAKTFYLLKDAELRAGELYATISLSQTLSHPRLSDLFSTLAEEEQVHARQIEMMRAIFLENRDAFLDDPQAEAAIAGFLENLETLRGYFSQNHARMLAKDFIDLALDLERHLVESHGVFLIKVKDASLKNLFASLNAGNHDHIRRLEQFRSG